jgi:dihydroneopterin aldolase
MPHASLHVRQIGVAVRLGWGASERALPQQVAVSVDLRFDDAPPACVSDDLQGTADYAAIVGVITGLAEGREYRLLEHFGRTLYDAVRPTLPPGCHLALTVTKRPPLAPVRGGASFRIGDWPGEPAHG